MTKTNSADTAKARLTHAITRLAGIWTAKLTASRPFSNGKRRNNQPIKRLKAAQMYQSGRFESNACRQVMGRSYIWA